MKRRDLLKTAAAWSLVSTFPAFLEAEASALAGTADSKAMGSAQPLKPPAGGSIPVAFLISDGAVVIDFCGPWEVFQDVTLPGQDARPFRPYTVAESTSPIHTSGGMKIMPEYTLANAPAPKVIVIPAQGGQSEAMLEWIRKSSKTTDVTMSVCTGAFLLARTGLLSGRAATTHHNSYKRFALGYPDIQLKRGARFVEDGNLASSGGLTSGIDLALHIVERYYGQAVARNTADHLEYQGQGWLNPNSNAAYANVAATTAKHPLCPVCDMDLDAATAPHADYKGKTYYFCSREHEQQFESSPEKYLKAK